MRTMPAVAALKQTLEALIHKRDRAGEELERSRSVASFYSMKSTDAHEASPRSWRLYTSWKRANNAAHSSSQ
jgi:hypothetical protein